MCQAENLREWCLRVAAAALLVVPRAAFLLEVDDSNLPGADKLLEADNLPAALALLLLGADATVLLTYQDPCAYVGGLLIANSATDVLLVLFFWATGVFSRYLPAAATGTPSSGRCWRSPARWSSSPPARRRSASGYFAKGAPPWRRPTGSTPIWPAASSAPR